MVKKKRTIGPLMKGCFTFVPVDGGDSGRLFVFGGWPGDNGCVQDGDYVILPNGDLTTRYQVDGEVQHSFSSDNTDWWCAVRFAPRTAGRWST